MWACMSDPATALFNWALVYVQVLLVLLTVAYLQQLASSCPDDPLIEAVAASLPPSAASQGLPTMQVGSDAGCLGNMLCMCAVKLLYKWSGGQPAYLVLLSALRWFGLGCMATVRMHAYMWGRCVASLQTGCTCGMQCWPYRVSSGVVVTADHSASVPIGAYVNALHCLKLCMPSCSACS